MDEKQVRTEQTLAHLETNSKQDPLEPPDAGYAAWLQVLLTHLVFFNTWGLANTFGVFQAYYTTSFALAPTNVSWVGGLQILFLLLVGAFSGRATDAGHFRPVFVTGVLCQVLGCVAASFCYEFWQVLLAQGVLLGLGNGLTFCPAIAVLSPYFSTKRVLAVGVAACGSATGGIVYPLMASRLLPRIGIAWTLRAIALVLFASLVPAVLLFKPRLPPRKTGPFLELSAFGELHYTFFALGMFFNFWGLYFTFFYLGNFARTLGFSFTDGADLILLLNGVGIVGTLVPALIASRLTGPLNILIVFSVFSAIAVYSWVAVSSRGGLYGFVTVYGVVSAAVRTIFPATASVLSSDMSKCGVRMGMVFTVVSFAALTGPSVAGRLLNTDNSRYTYAEVFSASSLMLGAILLLFSRVQKVGRRLKVKV